MKKDKILSIKRIIVFLLLSVIIIWSVECYKVLPIAPSAYRYPGKIADCNEFVVKFPRALSIQLFITGHNIRFIEAVKLEIISSDGKMILSSNSFEHRNDRIYLYPQIVSDNNYMMNYFRHAIVPVSLFANNEGYKMKLSYVSKEQVSIKPSLHMQVFIQSQYYNRHFNPFDANKTYVTNNKKSSANQFWELQIR